MMPLRLIVQPFHASLHFRLRVKETSSGGGDRAMIFQDRNALDQGLVSLPLISKGDKWSWLPKLDSRVGVHVHHQFFLRDAFEVLDRFVEVWPINLHAPPTAEELNLQAFQGERIYVQR